MVRLWLLIGAVVLALSNGAAAQTPPAPKESADVYKQLLDNAKVRVFQATFKPHTKASSRDFLNHVIYMQTDGTLVFEQAGHTGYEMTFKAGDAQWFPAQTRTMENDSDQEVRLLIVEVKEGVGPTTKKRGKAKRGRRKRRD